MPMATLTCRRLSTRSSSGYGRSRFPATCAPLRLWPRARATRSRTTSVQWHPMLPFAICPTLDSCSRISVRRRQRSPEMLARLCRAPWGVVRPHRESKGGRSLHVAGLRQVVCSDPRGHRRRSHILRKGEGLLYQEVCALSTMTAIMRPARASRSPSRVLAYSATITLREVGRRIEAEAGHHESTRRT